MPCEAGPPASGAAPPGSRPWQSFCADWRPGFPGSVRLPRPAWEWILIWMPPPSAEASTLIPCSRIHLANFCTASSRRPSAVVRGSPSPVRACSDRRPFRRFHRRGTAAPTRAHLEAVTAAGVRDGFGVDAVFAHALGELDELRFGLLFLGCSLSSTFEARVDPPQATNSRLTATAPAVPSSASCPRRTLGAV